MFASLSLMHFSAPNTTQTSKNKLLKKTVPLCLISGRDNENGPAAL
jgi:hypothetical protein